jgi:hypothetical protein
MHGACEAGSALGVVNLAAGMSKTLEMCDRHKAPERLHLDPCAPSVRAELLLSTVGSDKANIDGSSMIRLTTAAACIESPQLAKACTLLYVDAV